MKNFVIYLVYAPVAAVWHKKLFVPRNSSSVTVDLNNFDVEGNVSGSPWVV